MNAAHLHLILNHLPIAGIIFALPLLLSGYIKKNKTLAHAGLIAVVATGAIAVTTFLTGEPAEEIVEGMTGISEEVIEVHEEAAEKAIWLIGATGLAALVSLLMSLKNKTLPRWSLPLVVVLAIFSVGALAWTNNLGGEIRHPELSDVQSSEITD